MSFWSKFFIALAITILATTGAVVGVFAGQKEQIDMGGSIKYTVPYFTVTFLNYDDTVFETQQVAYGHDAVAPANNPTRPGHTFNGWTDYTNITQDRSVTANWIKNEAYLTTGSKWQAIVNASPVGSQTNIEQIEFVSSVPSGATLIGSVGVTNETATTVWTEGCGVFDVKAYYTALSTGKYKISFYSPYTIYAPKDSSRLFSNASDSNSLTNLTSLSFENFDTSKVTDMHGMFNRCKALISLNLSSFNTSNVTDMGYMFYGCSKLTSLNISSFNTSNVTNISLMFQNCSSLTSLNLSNFNTSNVTNMGGMFIGCSSLTSLNVSNFNTSKVTDMGAMFTACPKLTSLNVSNFDTSKVTDMRIMFNNCRALTSLNLSSFNTSNVTNMSGMFSWCESLTSLNLSNFNTSNVVDMSVMFNGCSKLTSLDVSSFNTSNVTNMRVMFQACSKLTSLNLSSFDMSKVTNTSNMLYGCSALTEIKTPKAIGSTAVDLPTKTNYSWFDQANTNNTYTQITSACLSKTLVLHENYSYLRRNWQTALINNNANFKQENIKTIQFVKSVPSGSGYTQVPVGATTSAGTTAYASGTAGVFDVTAYVKANSSDSTKYDVIFYSPVTIYAPTSSNYLFSNSTAANRLTNLTSISFGNFNTSKVTNMAYMFSSCSSLSALNVSNFNTSKVTDMSYMFNACDSLTSLNLSNFNTSNVTGMTGMFSYCSSLTSLNLSNFNTSKVTSMWSMFEGCSSLTSLNLSNFNTSKVTSMSYMFDFCKSLTSLNISSFNTSNVTGMYRMFYNCTALTSLDVSNFDTSKVTDMSVMFWGCSSLTSLNLSSFNTSNVTDIRYMFSGCSSLTSLNLSSFNTSNVTDIRYMFSGCSSLTSLNLSSFDMSKVTDTTSMLGGCSALTEIKTPKAIGSTAAALPTKTGYSWVDQANTNNAYTQITSACTNKTLVLRINTYTLSIDPNGGYRVSDNSTAVITVTKEYNSGESISERRKSGYTLTGYTLKNTATGSTTDVGGATFSFNSSTKTGMFTQGTVACTLVAEWTANTYAETFLNSYISIGTGEYNNGGTWTVSNGEYSFKTVSTTSNGGPYLTNLYSLMSNGEKYRIYFTAKATTAISLTASFEAGGSKAISLTTDYQEFFVDVTYNASSTYKALTFYSTGWTGQTLSIKNIKVAKLATFNSTYGTLPTPTRTGYTFNGWSKNFFNPTLTYGYTSTCTRNGEIFTFDTGSQNSSSLFFEIQAWNNTSHIQGLFSATSTGVHSFVFTKNSSITQLRFKYNGNKIDSCFYYDVSSLPDGSYVIQVNITTIQMNKIVVKDIMIEQNANNSKTPYVSSTNYVLASSTVNEPFNRTLFVSWTLNESYLRKDWQTALTNNNANFKQENIKTIQFVKSAPSNPETYTQVSVGATAADGATAFVSGTAGVSDITAYVKANSSDSTKYDVIFYSPVTIYAPVNSSSLFSGFTSLKSITFNNFDTTNATTMEGMFGSCTKLETITLGTNFKTSTVKSMAYMFNSCESLKSIDLSKFDTTNIENMTHLFSGCHTLKELDLSSFNTSNVTNMYRMFNWCKSLQKITFGNNFNTSKVTNMESMFESCSSLSSVNVSSFNTSKVTNMNGMFESCSKLTSLNLSSFDMSKVTNTGNMLSGCTALTEIKTPKAIGSAAVNLPTKTNYSWFDQANTNNIYTQITSACLSKTLVLRENYSYLRKDWQTALKNNNANFKQTNIKTIQFVKSVPSGSGYTQVPVGAKTSAGTTAFVSGTAGVSNITAYVRANSSDSSKYDVIFYSPVTIYAPVDSSSLFSDPNSSIDNCLTNLISISFANFNTSNVTNMSYMFLSCASLTSLNVSSFNTSNVTNMEGMFSITGIKSLNLSNFNTSKVTDMSFMFYLCSQLTSLNVSNFNTSNVTNMNRMFGLCTELSSLNLSSFDMSKVTNTGDMLLRCDVLVTIQTPKTIGNASISLPYPAYWYNTATNAGPYGSVNSAMLSGGSITLRQEGFKFTATNVRLYRVSSNFGSTGYLYSGAIIFRGDVVRLDAYLTQSYGGYTYNCYIKPTITYGKEATGGASTTTTYDTIRTPSTIASNITVNGNIDASGERVYSWRNVGMSANTSKETGKRTVILGWSGSYDGIPTSAFISGGAKVSMDIRATLGWSGNASGNLATDNNGGQTSLHPKQDAYTADIRFYIQSDGVRIRFAGGLGAYKAQAFVSNVYVYI